MEKIKYIINEKSYDVSVEGSPSFDFGKKERFSNSDTDISFNQEWYDTGYKAFNFLDDREFKKLKDGLTNCISKIITSQTGKNIEGFELSKYHKFVSSNEMHFKVVSMTRDLYPADFNFPLTTIFPKFEKLLGIKLTDVNPDDNKQLHIIVRINRPGSTDYNPPHKDVYEHVDRNAKMPRFVNIWIPVCGVTQKSSLPVAAGSHRLTEDQILRTFDGGVVEGNKYRVRSIKEWGGSNKMIRPQVNYGEVLFFTPHLIHGLAINEEEDQTRVALEFRLFKKD